MTQEQPLVSVIMATYNCEDTLEKAIDSIIMQTYQKWEFVICDDCSTDKSFIILKKYMKMYPGKFKVLQNQINSKLAFSLNRCLEITSGELIARMDADDISVSDRLRKQVNYMINNPEHMVVGSAMLRFDGDREYGIVEVESKPTVMSLLTSTPYCHGTIMMKKSVYSLLDGYTVSKRTIRGQDRDLWFRFYAKGFEGGNILEPLYKVREDINAIKRRTFIVRWRDMQTSYYGYRLLNFHIKFYPLLVIPILKFFVPKRIVLMLHNTHKKK